MLRGHVVAMAVVAVVVDRRLPPVWVSARRGRRGGRALEEPLDLEELGGAEKVLQLVLRYGNLSGVDEPTTSHTSLSVPMLICGHGRFPLG